MPKDPPPLTAQQQTIAENLFRHLEELRRSGVRRAEVDLDDQWGVRSVGQRVNMAGLDTHAILTPR